MHAKSSKPPSVCFSGMPLIPVPVLGVKMYSRLSRWLFDITVRRHERNWSEFSDPGFIFTYVQKYFSGPLTGGGAIAPAPMDPPLTDHLLLARVSVRGRGRVTLDHSTNLSKDMLCYPAEAIYSSFDLSLFGSMISHAADVPVSTNFFVFYPRARRYASTVL